MPGILYIFITSYDIIFVEKYGFNLGENGLAFLVCRTARQHSFLSLTRSGLQGQFVGAVVGMILLVPYIERYLRPKLMSDSQFFILDGHCIVSRPSQTLYPSSASRPQCGARSYSRSRSSGSAGRRSTRRRCTGSCRSSRLDSTPSVSLGSSRLASSKFAVTLLRHSC
jgi:hypothetical protein